MQAHYQSQYQSLFADPVVSATLHQQWHLQSQYLDATLYKQEMLQMLTEITEGAFRHLLVDARQLCLPVNSALQQWTTEEIMPPMLRIGVISTVFVMPERPDVQVALSQTIDEMIYTRPRERPQFGSGIRFFTSMYQAREWLKEREKANAQAQR